VKAALVSSAAKLDSKGNVLGSWTNSSSCYCEGWTGISCESGVITNV
jgi:hypothetical protein